MTFFGCCTLNAQKPDELLTQLLKQAPIEKVHLHLDRDINMAGETIWFKAYLLSEFLPDSISTSLYVELLDETSHIISRKIEPVLFYTGRGRLNYPIPYLQEVILSGHIHRRCSIKIPHLFTIIAFLFLAKRKVLQKSIR